MKTVRERVLQNYPGADFLDARTVYDRSGRPSEIHAVILDRGRRVVVRLDARTAHFLGEGARTEQLSPVPRPRAPFRQRSPRRR